MPRDISGTYTLPLAPIEPRTIPVVNWVNPTVEDIAAALNNIPLTALSGVPGSPGLLALTYTGLASRVITGTAGQIDVTNGDGLSGNPTLSITPSPTLDGTVALSDGQLQFPATQNPSSDPNTLDDYEEGTFTPTISAATPGDLSVSYVSRGGTYRKIGGLVFIHIGLNFALTYTTASGELIISGLPFPCTAEVAFSVSYFSGRASGTAPVARRRAADTSALRVADLLNNSTMAITAIPSGASSVLLLSGSYYV